MCRNTNYCSELGTDASKWDKYCPLPLPDYFEKSLDFFIEAFDLAILGRVVDALEMLSNTKSDELRNWYVEHGQMSGWHHRVKGLHKVKPKKYVGEMDPNKRIAPFENAVYRRDGYRCRYCHVRVVDTRVLKLMEKFVGPEHFKSTGKSNALRHGIALTFRATADHIIPLSYGGRTSMENLVTSCWNCNYGKLNALLEQMNIANPTKREIHEDLKWDGMLSNAGFQRA
jgi:5-methylcytosine-specific restriction endonuclease McrA